VKSVSSQIIIRSVPNDSMFWQVIGLTGIKKLTFNPALDYLSFNCRSLLNDQDFSTAI
jgi:hypothetical protein